MEYYILMIQYHIHYLCLTEKMYCETRQTTIPAPHGLKRYYAVTFILDQYYVRGLVIQPI